MFNAKNIGLASAFMTLATALVVGGWTTVVWALDSTYVRQETLTHELDTREFHRKEDRLTDRLLQYEIKGTTDVLSPTDKALEKVYKRDLQTLRTNRVDSLKSHSIQH